VFVIETKNFGQAYSVLSMLDYSADNAEEIVEEMRANMQGVITGMITTSVRDACIDGVDITKGEYIGFTDKTMQVSCADKVDTFFALADKLAVNEKEFLIVVFGAGVSEEDRDRVRKDVANKYSNVEFYEIDGGQDVYDFILIIE
jgi:dihydroxyacetone kinase-like predicted kinase